MSIDGAREMPQPWATWVTLLNVLAPIVLATAATLVATRLHTFVWIGTWVTSGLTIFVMSEAVWQKTCPT